MNGAETSNFYNQMGRIEQLLTLILAELKKSEIATTGNLEGEYFAGLPEKDQAR